MQLLWKAVCSDIWQANISLSTSLPPSPRALKKVHNVIFVRKGKSYLSWKSYFHCITFHHKHSLSVKENWWQCVILSLTCASTAFRLEIQSNMKVKGKGKPREEDNGRLETAAKKATSMDPWSEQGTNLAQKLNCNQSLPIVSPLPPGPQKWIISLSSG